MRWPKRATAIRGEMFRRGVESWEEPVFGRVAKDRDGQIGTIRKFDSGLAVAHCPEFRKEAAPAAVNVTPQVTPEKMRDIQERTRVNLSWQAGGPN